jgi:hypothetical protein
MGWENADQQCVLLNYNIRVEKRWLLKRISCWLQMQAESGSLYTIAGTGFRCRPEKENYFGSKESTDKPGWLYYFFVRLPLTLSGTTQPCGRIVKPREYFPARCEGNLHVVGNAEAGFRSCTRNRA